MNRPPTMFLAAFALLAACSADDGVGGAGGDPSVGTATRGLACFHGDTSVECAPTEQLDDATRTRVEDFYPSACFDGDQDVDGTPDFLDLDFDPGDDEAQVDALRCPRCNRGPGTQNDFRLEIDGSAGELKRGKVYAAVDGLLSVPTPDGVLTVALTDATRIDDGEPAPGAEIRVEGTIAGSTLEATRLKVLCEAPAALPPEDVPPEAEPPLPDPGEPLPPVE